MSIPAPYIPNNRAIPMTTMTVLVAVATQPTMRSLVMLSGAMESTGPARALTSFTPCCPLSQSQEPDLLYTTPRPPCPPHQICLILQILMPLIMLPRRHLTNMPVLSLALALVVLILAQALSQWLATSVVEACVIAFPWTRVLHLYCISRPGVVMSYYTRRCPATSSTMEQEVAECTCHHITTIWDTNSHTIATITITTAICLNRHLPYLSGPVERKKIRTIPPLCFQANSSSHFNLNSPPCCPLKSNIFNSWTHFCFFSVIRI